MKRNIACLLLAALSIIILPLLFAQQDQNSQGPDPEIAALKKRVSELESKLQIVENVEKMELAAKLADANARLANAEIDKFKRELKESNDEWLRTWSLWFAGISGFLVLIVGGAFWSWLRSRADQLIADSVEKSLNGFKKALVQVETVKNELTEAVGQVNILQDQIRILEKEHAASILETFIGYKHPYPEQINVLSETPLLDVFSDDTRHHELRGKAAEILANRKSTLLVSPALKYLNSVVDSDIDWKNNFSTQYHICDLVSFLGYIGTLEVYEGLKKFLNRLLTENQKYEFVFLSRTVYTLADLSLKLRIEKFVPELKNAIPKLDFKQRDPDGLTKLSEYFRRFNEPDGIIEILRAHLPIGLPDVENKCLELLVDHDPEFVEEWLRLKEAPDPKNEESE